MRSLKRKTVLTGSIVLIAASALLWLSDIAGVSAQRGDASSHTASNVARADQLDFALRFGTAADYTVYGAKGVRGGGRSEGKKGSGLDEASLGQAGSGTRARNDLNKALSMIRQLPCQKLDSALSGG